MVEFRERTSETLDHITSFYRSVGYSGLVEDSDKFFFAYDNTTLIAVVRIAKEHGEYVLRGMYMNGGSRGNGVRLLSWTQSLYQVETKGYSTGDICYGFSSKPTQTRFVGDREIPSHYKIFVQPDEAKVVVQIFQFYSYGMGKAAIAKELNKRKIPSPLRGRKITGREFNWSSTTIGKILERKKYIGIWQWGKTSRVLNPETDKFEKRDQPNENWITHLGKESVRDDLVIVSIDLWNQVQSRLVENRRKLKESRNKLSATREIKKVGSKSGTLLAGVLVCGECGAPMLQITGQKGGYYGWYTHYRKDKTKCANNRLMSRKKAEKKVCDLVKSILLTAPYIESCTKRANEVIKARLRVAPEEIKALELKRRDAERELSNLLKFVAEHGDISTTIKDSLTKAEEQIDLLSRRIQSLKTANVDKLLLTPFALKAKFEKLAEYFESDPVIANTYLKQLFPGGLKCTANRKTLKKNHNQNNSSWSIEGVMLVDEYLQIPKITYATQNMGGVDSPTRVEGVI